ncbi:4-alpha-glucanotransferase [Noviherbaspirillum sp.]|jgi:4-alpha-glucanotransferase|uniref:4-alpha-glucanotransferase n=1 Tax=Noviherbaspirillum sp. TaxID=1926288 RepID=UPI00260099A2|nr:4-alpha-glucanotransferase [Noviherbaspirillum sp.]
MKNMNDMDVFNLARAAGLAREWTSAKGEPMQVAPESLRAILDALDLPCATPEQCRDSHQRLASIQGEDVLPPLVTGVAGSALHLPGAQQLAGKSYRIELESGEHIDGRFPDETGAQAELPPIDRYGYHRLLVGERETTLAVAPPRCFGVADALQGRQADPRVWGLGVQLYSLRRRGDGGIGDFTGLSQLARSAASHGAAALAISPVHAMFSADVTRFSPYSPSSRLLLNVLHIDPANVLGPDALATALTTLGEAAASNMTRLEHEPLINWPASALLRLLVLRRLYEQFSAAGDQSEFAAFRARSGTALQDHARFEALHAWHLAKGESGDWRGWANGLRNPRGTEVETFAHEHAQEVAFHEFLQWQAARGLAGAQSSAREAGMPIGLITDLAVGADNGGSQAWSRQAEIINGLSVGAPPDVLNTRGQNWGLGAFSPQAMKARGFGAYIEMLRAAFAYAGGVRIDHVLGLSRLWLVPQSASPTQGAYLKYPMYDLLHLVALESWRHRAIVIGEDLGTIPPGFQKILAQHGLLGIRVLLFQQHDGRFLGAGEWSSEAIATTTTHDLPTVAGWWQGRDIDWAGQLDLLEPGKSEADARRHRGHERVALWQSMKDAGCANGNAPESHADAAPLDAVVGFLSATVAPLAMLPIEDALGLHEQPNIPGTIDTHPNWRRRLPGPAASLLDAPSVAHRLAIMNRGRSCGNKS